MMIAFDIEVNDVRLHVLEAVPEDATAQTPLAICLHGFPEYSGAWSRQVPPLLEAGYRVWAPDMRGYNLSECPPNVSDYRLSTLAADVRGLIEASGVEKVVLIAHDWGAAVAWWVAAEWPFLIEKLIIANVPHPRVFRRTVFTSPRQFLASWYIFFFQLPWLPEWALERNEFAVPARMFERTANPGSFNDADLNGYKSAWRNSGFAPMIRYYRAAIRYQDFPSADLITVPTLILWGKKDHALTHQMAEASLEFCTQAELEFLEDGTHWVQHDCHVHFNQKMMAFLSDDATIDG